MPAIPCVYVCFVVLFETIKCICVYEYTYKMNGDKHTHYRGGTMKRGNEEEKNIYVY